MSSENVEDLDADVSEADTEESTELEGADEEVAGQKEKSRKKKKKKRRKSVQPPGLDPEAASATSNDKQPAPDKQEADRKFAKALESVKQGEDMWVLLGSANIYDAKARKLFDALKGNSSVTSVNLTSNHISMDGVQAIVGTLESGGAPELISLDLRDNALSEEAMALLARLQKQRKELKIETGPLPQPPQQPPDAPPGARSAGGTSTSAAGGPNKGLAGRVGLRQRQSGMGGNATANVPSGGAAAAAAAAAAAGVAGQDFRQSPMFRRYFQSGDELEEVGVEEEAAAEVVEEEVDPAELWDRLEELLPSGTPAIPALGDVLHRVSACLEKDMPSVPLEGESALDDFRPHIRAALLHLERLGRVLDIDAPPVITQYAGPSSPQHALGSHRLWASDVVVLLLMPSNPTIDQKVAESGLLPRLMSLALAIDKASVLHCRALQMLRCSLRSGCSELWAPVLEHGQQQQQQQQQGQQGLPLQRAFAQIASQALGQPVGLRCGRVGFAVEGAQVLLQAADASNSDCYNERVKEALQGDEEWQGSIEPGGALHALLTEQEGELCGPRPLRPIEGLQDMEGAEVVADPFAGLGGNVISGPQLLALLKDMGSMMS